jgi:hypothetical protein
MMALYNMVQVNKEDVKMFLLILEMANILLWFFLIPTKIITIRCQTVVAKMPGVDKGL